MSQIEEELRAAFARHEAMAPAVGPVRARIDLAWLRARRRRLIRRAAGAAAAAVLMAGAAVPVIGERWQHGASPSPGVADLFPAAPRPDGALDLLLIGDDNRLRRQDPKDRLADTVMIVHVPADRSLLYLISLPRDGEVGLPGGARAKLNETLLRGGPALTEQVVTDLTGVDFDATVTIGFRALRAITAAVGGVEMCLPQAIRSVHNGKRYPEGCQHLGADDVAPVLQARNAQLFLRALAAKLTADGTLHSPIRVNELLMAGKDDIEIDGDAGALLGAVARGAGEVVGVGEPGFQSMGDGRERIYPEVGPKLFAAIRDDDLARWSAANPTYVLR
jgi:LCP family protein required for cell wall assembly